MRLCSVLLVLAALVSGTRLDASTPNPTARMIHATFKLVNPASTATCFLVNRPRPTPEKGEETILVTAGHVLEQMKGEDATLVLRKKNKDGTFARHEFMLKVRTKERPLWTKHPKMDLAALPMRLPKGVSAVPLPLAAIADESAVKNGRFGPGDEVRVACYPVRFEITVAAFPVIRRGSIAGFPLMPIKAFSTYLVDYNNFVGDSGGPVFVAEKDADEQASPLVVGVVLGQHLYDERTKLAFEERLTRHRMGLGIVAHAAFVRDIVLMAK